MMQNNTHSLFMNENEKKYMSRDSQALEHSQYKGLYYCSFTVMLFYFILYF